MGFQAACRVARQLAADEEADLFRVGTVRRVGHGLSERQHWIGGLLIRFSLTGARA
jgi:hypothetical protein